MSKQTKYSAPLPAVRTRRAYFDCRFGQLHVRTAFPLNGGFDEGVTLFCLHPSEATSRIFDRFLHEIADDRSVYAPDLPGFGESDAAPARSHTAAANAVGDLAADLRLRRIDVLGFGFGAGAALALAAARPELVGRLVLVGVPPIEGVPAIAHESLVLRVKLGAGDAAQSVKGAATPKAAGRGGGDSSDDSQRALGALTRVKFIDLPEYSADLFEAAPKTLAKQVAAFLAAKP